MISLVIVDDNPIVRAALRGIVEGDDEMEVLAEAANGREGLAAVRHLRPTVTLLDHRMPIADGLSVIGTLSRYTCVLVLTSDDDAELIGGMLHEGARGYLVHGEFEPRELLRAVRAVAGGRGWLSPIAASVAATMVRDQQARERVRHQQVLARRQFGLTDREEDVMRLLCEGLSNASIAHQLRLTEKTVKNHLNHVFAKLQVRSRTEAVIRWTHGR
ncbi:response regulator transcription factor [Dactylosporangium vinaceum]|uniref:LuxR C-terminal-related transcriptional regulator n=1 Tax=Dactylosporangium vinaceum TaxID=53362 RepID=A0ABV5MS05_9ACTN|nr:response regulator transcription factor [Dactylosporangium vinaceum]UAC00295.1 response regulator transcription factor [Dactylosporangium vinaceum]